MLKIHTKTGLWASNFDDLDPDTLLGCPTGRLLKRLAEGCSSACWPETVSDTRNGGTMEIDSEGRLCKVTQADIDA
jgi:hypothetical protein